MRYSADGSVRVSIVGYECTVWCHEGDRVNLKGAAREKLGSSKAERGEAGGAEGEGKWSSLAQVESGCNHDVGQEQ